MGDSTASSQQDYHGDLLLAKDRSNIHICCKEFVRCAGKVPCPSQMQMHWNERLIACRAWMAKVNSNDDDQASNGCIEEVLGGGHRSASHLTRSRFHSGNDKV